MLPWIPTESQFFDDFCLCLWAGRVFDERSSRENVGGSLRLGGAGDRVMMTAASRNLLGKSSSCFAVFPMKVPT